MHADSSALDTVSKRSGDPRYGRSAFTNGSTLFGKGVDGRSPWARLTRDTFTSLLVHCGGVEEVSETRRLAARRVSVLESELCFLENKFAQLRSAGAEPDANQLDLYGRLADRQRRLSEALGWDRTQVDATTTAADFVAQRAAQQREKAGAALEPSDG